MWTLDPSLPQLLAPQASSFHLPDHDIPLKSCKTKFKGTCWHWFSDSVLPHPYANLTFLIFQHYKPKDRDFNRNIFTKGFLLYNLLILISLSFGLNVNFTLRTAIANLNTFYLFMPFKILVLEMNEVWVLPCSHLKFILLI